MEEIYVNVEYPKHNISKPSPGHTGKKEVTEKKMYFNIYYCCTAWMFLCSFLF